jgi:hypothetical protein
VVNTDIVPRQRLPANLAAPFLVTIPDDSPLLGRKQPLFIFAVEYGPQQRAQKFSAPFPLRAAIGLTLNRE